MNRKGKRHLSVGSFLMIVISCLVVISFVIVLPKLSAGNEIKLTQLDFSESLAIENKGPETDLTGTGSVPSTAGTDSAETAIADKASVKEEPPVTPEPVQRGGNVTMTFGGTVAIEGKVRQAAYLSDSKQYDFADLLRLISPYMDSDINCAFAENLLLDDQKVSSLIVPSGAADAFRTSGIDTVCLGFPKAYDKGSDALGATITALMEYGLNVRGAWTNEPTDPSEYFIRTGNLNVAILQYTSALSDTGKRSIKKSGESWALPEADPDRIAEDISNVKAGGADIVVVCLHWGETGTKAPTKKQRTLAQTIAENGADLIIGTGSRVVQNIEYLTVKKDDGTDRSVLCAWSLGSLICENSNASRSAGVLLKLELNCDTEGNVTVRTAHYIPTYVWQYKQDGLLYFKTVAADRNHPDGLTSNETKNMEKAAKIIETALNGSPVTCLEQ